MEDTTVTWCLFDPSGGAPFPRRCFLVAREIDCGNWLARGYMPAHQHCELFYKLNLVGSTLNFFLRRRSGKLIRSECALRQSHGTTESSHRQSTCNVDFDDDVGGKCDVSALICSTTYYVTQVPWSAACRPARTIRYTTTNHATERDLCQERQV